jgi:hypothetical protein
LKRWRKKETKKGKKYFSDDRLVSKRVILLHKYRHKTSFFTRQKDVPDVVTLEITKHV